MVRRWSGRSPAVAVDLLFLLHSPTSTLVREEVEEEESTLMGPVTVMSGMVGGPTKDPVVYSGRERMELERDRREGNARWAEVGREVVKEEEANVSGLVWRWSGRSPEFAMDLLFLVLLCPPFVREESEEWERLLKRAVALMSEMVGGATVEQVV